MIQHVTVEVAPERAQEEAAWWEQLGFVRVEAPATLRDRVVWLQLGDQQLHLLHSEAPRAAGHFAIVHAWPPPVPIEERAAHWGARRGYATSPGGHVVELMEAPPASSPPPR